MNAILVLVMCLEEERTRTTQPKDGITTTIIPVSTSASERTAPSNVLPKLYPHMITIERLGTLLRQATDLFQPEVNQNPIQKEPNQQMQPPSDEPYNFYLPQYEHDHDLIDGLHQTKLDSRSRKLERIIPPPLLMQNSNALNGYYNLKSKKLPKKYDGSIKSINYKWPMMSEEIISSGSDNGGRETGNIPPIQISSITNKGNPYQHGNILKKFNHPPLTSLDEQQAIYMLGGSDLHHHHTHDTHYDDSFFAMDMGVPQQNDNRMESANRLHNTSQKNIHNTHNTHENHSNSNNHNAMMMGGFEVLESGDDLVAAPSTIHHQHETPKITVKLNTK